MRLIYLDHNATTPMAPEVTVAMLPYLTEAFGNPYSLHAAGRRAKEGVDLARAHVAALLGAQAGEIVFTSGGTESNNTAVFGLARAAVAGKRHIITSVVEHAAIARPCLLLEGDGWSVTRVPVDTEGMVSAKHFVDAMTDQTAFISLMHSNNETGALQPIAEVARAARARGIPVHCDAAQSVGKLAVDVTALNVDLLTVAGHKLYGPKGVGALFVRSGVAFEPFQLGAPHEDGRRAGTLNTAGIAGLGEACRLAAAELPGRTEHLRSLRDRLHAALRALIPDLKLNGPQDRRLPNTLNVAFPGVDSNALLNRIGDRVATAAGAACHSGVTKPSAVLKAMGLSDDDARASLRLCTGRINTAEEMDRAAEIIAEAVAALRG